MTREEYAATEAFMLRHMEDSAHDELHVYRVLYLALELAQSEPEADRDILIAACLLHDVGRDAQSKDLELDHAAIGAEMALEFLLGRGWPGERARQVADCVATHRYRRDNRPQSLEAKILFDADKLDVSGAMGMARTLIYSGQILEPLYQMDETGRLMLKGTSAERHSFLQEFNYKQTKLYDRFFTPRARELAQKRKQAAFSFYNSLLEEIGAAHKQGPALLEQALDHPD